MDLFSEYFGSYKQEPAGSYSFIGYASDEGFRWPHWVLVFLGPVSIIFWLALGWWRNRLPENSVLNGQLNDETASDDEEFERVVLPLMERESQIPFTAGE